MTSNSGGSAAPRQRAFIGAGITAAALADVERLSRRRCLIVASESSWKRFSAALGGRFPLSAELRFFHGFSPNPSWEEVLDGCRIFEKTAPDLLVAIGGGSGIDMAKAIRAVRGAAAYPPEITGGGPPLAAIPTTAGSGSEATPFAVYYKDGVKQSLDHPSLLPEYAIVDPMLCSSMPPGLTAATGFDALSQAVESFWARRATDYSRSLAEQAIRLLLPNIVRAVDHPDPDSRLAMSRGANFAGQAIAVTRTTAPHALSYRLTKRYGVPHGHAAALFVPYFMRLHSGAGADAETRAAMRRLFALLGVDSPEGAAELWRDLLARCGLAATLRDAGVMGRDAIVDLADSVNVDRLANNPVRLSREGLLRLLA